ncbi:MAG: transcriptional repressor [Coriobacteriia bacterium]|nr:transcriptional repressor [Coriobacteriia bacterium]MBS5477553.1 transcriptional repressor [Coriobacteriia bacterium]
MATQRRNTRQRQLVLDAVRTHNDHPTADEIYVDLRADDPRISRGTVYRNLRLLSESGEIRTFKVPGGDRFDWRVDDHAHVVCLGCGCVCDAPIDYQTELDEHVERQTGFSIDSHHTLFEGLCPNCRASHEQASECVPAAKDSPAA